MVSSWRVWLRCGLVLCHTLGMLDRARLHVELGVEAQRRERALRRPRAGHRALVAARADRRLAVTDLPRPEMRAPRGTTGESFGSSLTGWAVTR